MRARQKRYEQTAKGKQCLCRYGVSEKGRAVHKAIKERFKEKHGVPSTTYYKHGLHIVNRVLSGSVELVDGGTF